MLQLLILRLSAVSVGGMSPSFFLFVETKGEEKREGKGKEKKKEVVCTWSKAQPSGCD